VDFFRHGDGTTYRPVSSRGQARRLTTTMGSGSDAMSLEALIMHVTDG
jgi:hypothetical protein